jgi:hypothetical protein
VRDDKRQLHRVTLARPCEAQVDGKRAFIVGVSLDGLRVAQQSHPGAIGETRTVAFEWEGQKVSALCELRWLQIQQNMGRASYAKSLYHVGYYILEASHESHLILRQIVLEYVMRALDEQKANARGVPALAPQSYQAGTAREFLKQEYVGDQWRETRTANRSQPPSGFTVGADHSREEIDMLREAYAIGDNNMRQTIQKMAEISTSTESGVPTRKYVP